MPQPWWERWPNILEFELAELKKNGIEYDFNTTAFEKGELVLNLAVKINGKPLKLKACFPDLYPLFRFEVYAPDLDLEKHQNPFEKNLCLIGRSSANWNQNEDTLAKFITEQLPKLLESAQDGNENLEEKQGEPFSEYYPSSGGMVLIDSAWHVDSKANQGTIMIGMDRIFGIHRIAVTEIKDSAGGILARSSPAIERIYPEKIEIEWVRSKEPLKIGNAESFFQIVAKEFPAIRQDSWKYYDPRSKTHHNIIGILFPEEVKYKTFEDGWVFILIQKSRQSGGKKKWKYDFHFMKTGRAGIKDMQERVPQLAFLQHKSIGVVGLGSIGAPSVIELAKSGIREIRTLDYDYVDAGTTVRWPLGFSALSVQKTDVLKSFISINFPFTIIAPYNLRIGAVGSKQMEVLEQFLSGVDLIFDASAEIGVHNLLSTLARERGIPYILASATPGAWGGVVARFLEGKPCWYCFEKARTEGKIPIPPEDDSAYGKVQPAGCGSPTFTGTSFDLQEISLAAVRMIVSTLSGSIVENYPDSHWDIAMLALRDKNGIFPPKWDIIKLLSYPECICAKKL